MIRYLIIFIGLLVGQGLAQTLEVNPWLPAADGRTTLTGQGFKPTATIALEFMPPRPMLPDGKAVPDAIQANDQGGFSLELKITDSQLIVMAKSGLQTANLTRAKPQLEFVTDGNTIVARDAISGRVAQRFYLSGLVKTLEKTIAGYRATVQVAPGIEEVFLLEAGKIIERVTFPPSSVLLDTLNKGFKEQVFGDPVVFWQDRVSRDPTNPLLKVKLGLALQAAKQGNQAKSIFASALEVSAPFYVFIRLAQEYEKIGQAALADAALTKASLQYAESGYDPGFGVSRVAMSAWGDPLATATILFKNKNPKRAEAWMAFLRNTMPRFPGSGTVFLEYAAWLETQNRNGEARQVHEFMTDLDRGSAFRFGDTGLIRLAGFALAGALVALVSFLLLQFVLLLKYWSQQTKDLQPFGGRFGAVSRAPLMRLRHSLPGYYTFTEKIVLLVLLLAAIAGVVVWQYSTHAQNWVRQEFLMQGTAGGSRYFQALNDVPQPSNDYLRGLGLQLSGDTDKAIEAYRASGVAGAANNLGVILALRGDNAGSQREFQRAASLGSTVANQNLGSSIVGFRAAFHNTHRKGLPMLEVPNTQELVDLRFGSLDQEFGRMVQDPWSYWLQIPLGLPTWANQIVGALLLMMIALTFLWLLVPRVPTAKTAPRSILYHLGALLIPGSGLADEVWGILLLPPAIAVGALAIIKTYNFPVAESIFQSSSVLGLSTIAPLVDLQTNWQFVLIALAVIYGINFLAWLLETLHLARRKTP